MEDAIRYLTIRVFVGWLRTPSRSRTVRRRGQRGSRFGLQLAGDDPIVSVPRQQTAGPGPWSRPADAMVTIARADMGIFSLARRPPPG